MISLGLVIGLAAITLGVVSGVPQSAFAVGAAGMAALLLIQIWLISGVRHPRFVEYQMKEGTHLGFGITVIAAFLSYVSVSVFSDPLEVSILLLFGPVIGVIFLSVATSRVITQDLIDLDDLSDD
jgi:hypothetical protein